MNSNFALFSTGQLLTFLYFDRESSSNRSTHIHFRSSIHHFKDFVLINRASRFNGND